MRYNEFRKWLKDQGCTFDESRGKDGHITIHYQGRKTVMPFHGSKEIGKGLVHAIKKTVRNKIMRYPITIEKIDGEYVATLGHKNHRFQGACSAVTKAEVAAEAEKMVEAVIASALMDGDVIPEPKSCARGNSYVILPPLLSAKVSLFLEMQRQGKRKADLARDIGVNQKQIDRLFSPNHASVLSQLAAAAESLGRKLEIRLA